MAFFRDTPVNPNTARHELHYVNQQYDYLFGIRWDDGRRPKRALLPLVADLGALLLAPSAHAQSVARANR